MNTFDSVHETFSSEVKNALQGLAESESIIDDVADIVKTYLTVQPNKTRRDSPQEYQHIPDEKLARDKSWQYSEEFGYYKHILVNESCATNPSRCVNFELPCVRLCQCRICRRKKYKEATQCRVCPMYAREFLEYTEKEIQREIENANVPPPLPDDDDFPDDDDDEWI